MQGRLAESFSVWPKCMADGRNPFRLDQNARQMAGIRFRSPSCNQNGSNPIRQSEFAKGKALSRFRLCCLHICLLCRSKTLTLPLSSSNQLRIVLIFGFGWAKIRRFWNTSKKNFNFLLFLSTGCVDKFLTSQNFYFCTSNFPGRMRWGCSISFWANRTRDAKSFPKGRNASCRKNRMPRQWRWSVILRRRRMRTWMRRWERGEDWKSQMEFRKGFWHLAC